MCKEECEILTENVQLKEEILKLNAENARLKAELEKYQQPPKDSSNSSMPPSTDKKPNKYPEKTKSNRKSGGQPGHKGVTKLSVEKPDEIIEVLPHKCDICGCEHIINTNKINESRQEIDLPPVTPYVKEYQQMVGKCSKCGSLVIKDFPEDIKAKVNYGKNILANISYLNVQCQMGYKKISQCFKDLFNCPICEGTVYNKLKKTADILKPFYDNIFNLLKNSHVVGSDETGLRIEAQNAWSFIFQNTKLTYLTASFKRSFEVIEKLFGETFDGAWVSDRLATQLKIKAIHQFCLAHLIRSCKFIIQAEKSKFGEDLLGLFYEMIKFRKDNDQNYSPSALKNEILEFKRKMGVIFGKPPPEKYEKILFNGLLGRQKELTLFLEDSAVPFDNNGSERGLRPIVTKRKVSNGFRSFKGAKFYCIIASVFQTFQKQGLNIMSSLRELLNGKTILLEI